jgi:hypothetical protein
MQGKKRKRKIVWERFFSCLLKIVFLESAAVEMALSYQSYLGVAIRRVYSPIVATSIPIPQFPGAAAVSELELKDADGVLCQQVQVVFSSSHPLSTELEVVLTSPSGTQSVLAQLHAISFAGVVTVLGADHSSYTLGKASIGTFGSRTIDPVEGEAVSHPNTACDSEWPKMSNLSYAGKVVLVARGDCPFTEKAVNLASLGCKVCQTRFQREA